MPLASLYTVRHDAASVTMGRAGLLAIIHALHFEKGILGQVASVSGDPLQRFGDQYQAHGQVDDGNLLPDQDQQFL